ncbi:serine/threonine-protein kinase [Streptomyces sp. NBC_00259]|uniref:serine/threonine-protein kinase n=1 Tax=Streptomyces sp. NBC_00259 TaxID=2903643 RepID=UPI002E27B19F|nr:serine/threonine-protein kinase [Streptomyces sp. NBC_00259]
MPPVSSAGQVPEAEHPEFAGRYRLEECLGSGGMGVVHLATSASGLRLAVKVVHAAYAADPEFRARFRQEVAAARRVSGAFTAPVVDADPEAERPWMATLFIDGPTLSERVKRNGPLDAAELARVGAGLAEGLRDIHRAGVVHRDLKPSNVLLAHDGPKVIDFGISRPTDSDLRTETGKLIGTPPFMAPEQFQRPREVGPEADVFAMGAVLVHAATGRGPFDSDSPYIVAYQVVHNEPDLAGVPEELAPLLLRCLAKSPAERPTPDELMAALRPLTQGAGSQDTAPFIPAQRRPTGAATPPTPPAVPTPSPHPSRRSETSRTSEASTASTAKKRRIRRAAASIAIAALVTGGILGLRAALEDTAPTSAPDSRTAETFRPWSVPLREGDGENRTPVCTHAPANAPADAATDAGLFCTAPGLKAARLNPADGAITWSVKATGESADSDVDMPPTLSGGLVHVNAPDGAGGRRLEALDPADGSVRWSTGISSYASVAYAGDTVLLVANDGKVRGLDGATGQERWTGRRGGPGTQWVSAPGADGPALAVTGSADGRTGRVTAVDPVTGTVRWEKRLNGRLTPVEVSGDALFLLSADAEAYTSAVVRLDLTDRSVRRVPLQTPVDQAQAAVRGDTVYLAGSGGALLAVDTRPGTDARTAQLWRLETSVTRVSRPVVSGARLYVTAADGRLLAVDAERGALLGQTKPRMDDGRYTFAPMLPAPVAASGTVFATAPDGSVFGVEATAPARW